MSRLILHLGPPKTGTTYLQQTLKANAARLGEHGYRVITDQRLLRDAASDLAGAAPETHAPVPHGAWDRLREELASHGEGTTIASCERFSVLDRHQAARFVQEAPVSEVRGALTLRDPLAVLPSRWQERVKNGGTETWLEFCGTAAEDPAFLRRMLRMRSALRTWTGALGDAAVDVVVVPVEAEASVLVERFCEATGIPEPALAATPAGRQNAALGTDGVEVLRRVNELGVVNAAMTRDQRKSLLAGLFPSRPGQVPVPTRPAVERTRAYTRALISDLEASGCRVAGSPGELLDVVPVGEAADSVPSPEAVTDAAVHALSALAVRTQALRARLASAPAPRRRWWQRH